MNQIQAAGPDDAVIISFSGHASTDSAGNFYLFPFDESQTGDDMPIGERVSAEELASWLDQIDAGNLVMILDSCEAAALPGIGFKAAPLGNRGIGQLAYDKGMLLLAGTQSDNDAKESGLYRHGLLTYALVNEGLVEDQAKSEAGLTIRQWLQFGEDIVPSLYLESISKSRSRLQRPYLFDFSRSADSITIEGPAKRQLVGWTTGGERRHREAFFKTPFLPICHRNIVRSNRVVGTTRHSPAHFGSTEAHGRDLQRESAYRHR